MADTMKLHAREWFTITGRGPVASIGPEQLPPGPSDGRDLLNQHIDIDGEPYVVIGVEWCLVDHGARCPKGYGLLVKPAAGTNQGEPQ